MESNLITLSNEVKKRSEIQQGMGEFNIWSLVGMRECGRDTEAVK